VNRVPPLGSDKKAVCGKCKARLEQAAPTYGHPIELSDADFSDVIRDGRATVVDFWAPWCGPCRTIGPVLDQLASERRDVRFAKINVDENPLTASSFHVQGIPLIVFIKEGTERGRVVGAVPRPQIEAAIRQYFG
jgi:thioredoxin